MPEAAAAAAAARLAVAALAVAPLAAFSMFLCPVQWEHVSHTA